MSEFGRPDDGFVLHGRKTPIRTKPNERTYMTNSEKTLSSHNLSHTTLNRSGTDWDSINVLFNSANSSNFQEMPKKSKKKKPKETGEFSLDLRSLNSSLNKSLNKSVSFNNKLPKRMDDSDEDLEDMFEEELQKLIDSDDQEIGEQTQQPALVGKPHHPYTQWFTDPVHLTKSSEYPVFESMGVEMHKTSPKNRTVGMIGTELAQQRVSSEVVLDDVAQEYFPVTLGTMRSIANTVSPAPSNHASYSHRPSSTKSMSYRPMSAKSEPPNTSYATMRRPNSALNLSGRNPKLEASSDYNYLKASQQFITQSVTASPHQYELAKLRMERLRLEEEKILDNKRQEELERIRGPTPKWYEMKTPHFTYEHFKHNQLLKSKERWQELMDYRTKLTSSSKDFSKGHLSSQASLGGTHRVSSRASTRSMNLDDSGPLLRTATRSYENDFMHSTPVI
ncbi:uncharacterized protein [Amphiura filiformis]|uniref:uncharacterized protein n=1 Tax=Amphiura filiformis TaxID=82378 RepID=UPI003B225B76